MNRKLVIGCLLSLIVIVSICPAEELSMWDFESEEVTWRPRADEISVSRVEGVGATEDSKASLWVRGTIEVGWNYVISDTRPMKAEQLYRLSAWLRVNKIGPTTPMPYLKCEFLAAEPGRSPGRINTGSYDSSKMGEWQHLVGEFRAPEGTEQCWIALEKGGSGRMEIDANLDNVKIERIDRLSIFDKYRLQPIPKSLDEVKGVHPRIYLDSERIAQLRDGISTTHAPLWAEVKEQADRAVKRKPPEYVEDDKRSGDEQLWQRSVGNTMPFLAMAYVLTGDRQYLDSAREWALASCSYKTWGLGRIDGMDLATGHQLFGLGIVYDWCYEDLGEEALSTIRETLVKRTSAMFEAAATEKAWWRRSYLQNHLWVNICGMAVVGLALFDEVEDASQWIGLPLDKFEKTMAALGHDGASHEGVGYWGYGVEYMLKFMHLARELLDVNMYDDDWWRNTASYRQYLALPRDAWTRRNNVVDIADCPRSNWYGPDYLLRGLASEYQDGHAQWLAQETDSSNVSTSEARWLNLVWFDPELQAVPPDDLPTLYHFDDMDIVSARSGWSGDESLVVFKCGPYIGHEAVQEFSYDPGGGHVHPDANHFVLFAGGEWLIRDDGYRAKWTGQHNTLLIDGKGQLGEGRAWFNGIEQLRLKARPRVIRAVSSAELDHIAGDATEAYPRDIGLRSYTRHLIFLKPDVLIVVDDIELDEAKELELRFHPEQGAAQKDGKTFLVKGENTLMRVDPLTGANVNISAEDIAGEGRHGEADWSMFTIRMNTQSSHWRNAVALSWTTKDSPVDVNLKETQNIWTFSAGHRTVEFDWATGTAKMPR
ncbi:DUF4962 domain-containing protein [Candidatus Poribacteria bacterium]